MDLEIRVLGPVEVRHAGRPVDVGPRQRRAVLAALAVDAGVPVPLDALVERVWGRAVPEAPRSALYAHVARLRQALRTSHAESTSPATSTEGYVLDVDPTAVDLHRWHTLTEAGRDATVADEARIETLRAAMDLWRGPPLPSLASEWAARLRRSLEAQFVGLADSWGAVELRLGNAQAVVDRLAQVLGAYPLAEPLVGLQMRALCALGRTSEALDCYAEARTGIVEQLGTEPGRDLRELHVAVLRGELDVPSSATVTSAVSTTPVPSVPRQLPADVASFVGRVDERDMLHTRLKPRSRRHGTSPVAAVYGPAGQGTSTLAVHAAHRLAGDYPDGQVYLDLRGSEVDTPPLDPAEAVARVLRSLGATPPAPPDLEEAAALLRSATADRRLLLVLDNAADAAQVRPLLLSGAECGTIVTSRQPLAVPSCAQVRLGPLTVPESVTLLAQWVGADRVAAEPEEAEAIARSCECLPLALRIAGARLVARPGWPLAQLRDRLADENRRLDTLEVAGIAVRTTIAGSYQRLKRSADPTARAAAEAFTVLGTSGEPEFDRFTAARVLARSEADTERVLECLVDAQLLETSAPGSYRMGDLLRLYARERLVTAVGGGLGPPRSGVPGPRARWVDARPAPEADKEQPRRFDVASG